MTDYNDGKWHGWNGGECPVHPDTVIDVCLYDDGEVTGETAEQWFWNAEDTRIRAFRVVQRHDGPRERWVVDGAAFKSKDLAAKYAAAASYDAIDIIHVREVIEE